MRESEGLTWSMQTVTTGQRKVAQGLEHLSVKEAVATLRGLVTGFVWVSIQLMEASSIFNLCNAKMGNIYLVTKERNRSISLVN